MNLFYTTYTRTEENRIDPFFQIVSTVSHTHTFLLAILYFFWFVYMSSTKNFFEVSIVLQTTLQENAKRAKVRQIHVDTR